MACWLHAMKLTLPLASLLFPGAGLLVPDIPLEETPEIRKVAESHGLELVLLTTPTTPQVGGSCRQLLGRCWEVWEPHYRLEPLAMSCCARCMLAADGRRKPMPVAHSSPACALLPATSGRHQAAPRAICASKCHVCCVRPANKQLTSPPCPPVPCRSACAALRRAARALSTLCP